MLEESLFFPLLARREKYSVKRDGSYYANYSHYREEIREDCLGRCIYCDTHENELDGSSSMNLDHFRPKDYPQFKDLVNDPNNLVWACGACNRAKWNHWPAIGTDDLLLDDQGFIDPFKDDRHDYFRVQENGEIVGLKPPSEYLIGLLFLNRPFLIKRRINRKLSSELVPSLKKQIDDLESKTNLTDIEKEQLKVFKISLELTIERLDFSLR